MKQLNILLFDALDWHRMQTGPLCSLTDGQCVAGIALATAHERGDMLGRHQQHLMTHGFECPAPIMGTGTSFHGNGGGLELRNG